MNVSLGQHQAQQLHQVVNSLANQVQSQNPMADYSCDIQTEGAVSVEPSGSYIVYHGNNNETHNQVLLGSPQTSDDPA